MKIKINAYTFLAMVLLTVVLLTVVSAATVAQSPEPKLEDPLGRRWFEEERSERSSSLTLSSLKALSVEDETEALAKFSKSSPDFEHMFIDVVASARQSLAVVRTKGLSKSPKARKRAIALGTVVSEDGLVLTKASELKGDLYCEFASGEIVAAELIGLDTENDVALLKTEISGLAVGDWGDSSLTETGDWVATPLDHQEETQVGIVSVDARFIEPSKPFIGIYMNNAKPTGILVANVQPKSPADEGGLKARDVILKLDDQLVKDIEDLRKVLEQHDAGDLVTLSILRDDRPKKIKLTLAERDKVSDESMRSNQQNSMGSRLSRRRKNFPMAFQHDTALQDADCGGPIVNLDGEIVGVNIARAGRVSSLAIPMKEVLPIIERLRTGDYSPAVVNAERIKKVATEIEETRKMTRELTRKLDLIEGENETISGTRRGLELAAKDIQNRIDDMKKDAQKRMAQEKDASSELYRLERLMRELRKDHERLETGLKY